MEQQPFGEASMPRAGVAWIERSHVTLSGKDRAQLLHGLCTNDIKRLQPGDSCEAFLTNVQGRVVGYIDVYCQADVLLVESAAGEAENVIRHLDRYVVREDVTFANRSSDWRELLVGGPAAVELVHRLLEIPSTEPRPGHCQVESGGKAVSVRYTALAGPGTVQLVGEPAALASIHDKLLAAGGQPWDDDAVDAARIEAGIPIFGRDITPDNLPQEVNRNVQAISFQKGCYLGQETVARIDALGHVNRRLLGLRFPGAPRPSPGDEIVREQKVVAHVTSSCYSPRLATSLALAYVRRGQDLPGVRLASPWGEAEVVTLPVT